MAEETAGASAKATQEVSEQTTEAAAATPVKAGDRGNYGDLVSQKRKNGETEPLDMGHRPFFKAQAKAAEIEKGELLSKAELAKLKANTPAVATPRAAHQQKSRTYGGRNTKEKIDEDAADLEKAAEK